MQEVKEVPKVRVRVYRVSGNFLRHMLKHVLQIPGESNRQYASPTTDLHVCKDLFLDTAFHAYFCDYFLTFSLFMENHTSIEDTLCFVT